MLRPPTVELFMFSVLAYCAVAILIWDIIICLRREYLSIWKRKWSFTSLLYSWCRYFPLVAQTICISLPRPIYTGTSLRLLCGRIQYFRVINSSISLITLQSWLLYRAYIIYSRSRGSLLMLMFILTVSVGLQIAGAAVTMQHVKYRPGCSGETEVYAAFLFVAGTAIALFTSLTVSVVVLVRAFKAPGGWAAGKTVTRIMIRDNVITPILINLGFIPCAVLGLKTGLQNIIVWEVGFIYINLILSLFVCRMIVNVRETFANDKEMVHTELTVFRSFELHDTSITTTSAGILNNSVCQCHSGTDS
ncbi:hypothetical protein E1B28_005705 [Marasmius oreades]|uniref:DUF6533 domain-containing protein n=1 Tax=Marasmius oreades TaxID=181124 RepID=A0A9P7S483_9AGAR|nr:uncharacterized protein E1B28_005705 [Marasmius oreades]KAG7094898.1 hypothetical protein E1B28_005705 [Marasmius oreades]